MTAPSCTASEEIEMEYARQALRLVEERDVALELVKQLLESGEWMRGMAEEGSPLDLLTKRAEDFLARRALEPKP